MQEPADANPPPPFETQWAATERVRGIYDAMASASRRSLMADRNHQMLCGARTEAGADVGVFDHTVLLWLTQFEPETCAAIAGTVAPNVAAASTPARRPTQR